MSLVIAFIVAFTVLEPPWRWLAIALGLAWEGFEIYLYLRWRGVKATTGAEALVGTKGVALTDCRPDGQARIKGQIWTVNCPPGVSAGDPVVVTEVNGLRLEVAPNPTAFSAR